MMAAPPEVPQASPSTSRRPTRRMHPLSSFFGLATAVASALVLSAGCASPARVAGPGPELLELRAQNRGLEAEVDMLRDSIAVLDFTVSGEMDREFRRIQAEVDRLTYLLEVCRDGGQEVAVLQVDDLFEPSSPILTLGGKRRIDSVAVLLDPAVEYRIEAHADSTAPGPATAAQYPTNWELSGARASAVLRRLVDYHGLQPSRVRAVSYGAARPAYTNSTRTGRARNRRVRITAVQDPSR